MDDIQIILASVIYSECLKIATTLALDLGRKFEVQNEPKSSYLTLA